MARSGDTASVPAVAGFEMPSRPALSTGARLGRYELLTLLARGGMAEVWLARQRGDLGFSRLVAVKTIRPELASNAEFRKMFLDEATIASRIRHTNVVEVLDLGEEEGVIYLAMSYVEGGSLRSLENAWHSESSVGEPVPLPLSLSVRITIDVASGLHAAHELHDDDGTALSVVHRDVSPQNVLIGFDGIAKLCDFGIAKALGRVAQETEAGALKGKFSYLSPEQAERRPLDRRSDVFALGIVFWELITGRRLFQADDVVATVAATLRCVVPDPRESTPSLPPAIAEVSMRALARDPEQRYPSCEAFVVALEAAARANDLNGSARDLGALVESLVRGEALARRRHAERAAEAVDARTEKAVDVRDETDTGHEVDPSPRARERRRGLFLVAGVAIAVVSVWAWTRQPTTSVAPAAQPSLVASTEPPTRGLAASASAASEAQATAEPSTSVAASATRPPSAAPRPKAPKYKSPYGP